MYTSWLIVTFKRNKKLSRGLISFYGSAECLLCTVNTVGQSIQSIWIFQGLYQLTLWTNHSHITVSMECSSATSATSWQITWSSWWCGVRTDQGGPRRVKSNSKTHAQCIVPEVINKGQNKVNGVITGSCCRYFKRNYCSDQYPRIQRSNFILR